MSDENHSGDNDDKPSGGGFGVDDVFFTLFRHKWLIGSFIILGVGAAVAVRFIQPPIYISKAKLNVPYVVETKAVNTANPETQIISTGSGGLAVIESEIEILRSLDLCVLVAETVGPELILAKKGGGTNLMAAAGVVASGLIVNPTKTATITVAFQDTDREIVRPVLSAVIKAYAVKHRQVHSGEGVWDDYFIKQRDEWSAKILQTEHELRRLRSDAKLISVEDSKKSYQFEITKLKEKLFDAEMELAERRSQLGTFDLTSQSLAVTNAVSTPIPSETIEDYSAVLGRVQYLIRYERKLLSEGLKEAHPWVLAARAELVERAEYKTALERKFPTLVGQTIEPAAFTATTNLLTPVPDLKRLTTTVTMLGTLLSNAQFQAAQVMELEPRLAELERQRNLQETNYKFYAGRMEQSRSGGATGDGKMLNLSVIQSPSPPAPDSNKMVKLIGIAFGGCFGMGLGLAFLADLVLDRTLKRSTDVKRQLRLPVMLTIPHTHWSSGWFPAWMRRARNGKIQRYDAATHQSVGSEGGGLTPWNPVHHLRLYTDGMRERLITYFEVNNLTHRPKLVALTSCGRGGGVTTLASGLAASLSMTGDGNVLLVDMNVGDGAAHSFHKGKPGCGLAEASDLDLDAMAGAAKHQDQSSIPADRSTPDSLSRALPAVFNDVMPKLKLSGYDYIVFDLPPVSQTSVTPRMSGHMDMVLFVIESEKTSQHQAIEAAELMREARAKVVAILNKCKAHVPTAISSGF